MYVALDCPLHGDRQNLVCKGKKTDSKCEQNMRVAPSQAGCFSEVSQASLDGTVESLQFERRCWEIVFYWPQMKMNLERLRHLLSHV